MKELINNKKAVIYTRSSVESTYTKKESIENQVEFITKFCLDNEFTIVKVYQDDGFSGSSMRRPGIEEMMDDMKLRKFDTIIVKDLSRFSRNYLEAGHYLDEVFPKEKIRFIAITDNYDSATYYDEQSFALRLWLNNMYIQDIGNKIRFNNERRARSEYMSAGCRFGYTQENGEYKIVEEDAKTVRYIFKLYIEEGLSFDKIAKRLESEKVYSPGYSYYLKNGKVKNANPEKIINNPYNWQGAMVSRILLDTIYYGTVINRKIIKKNGVVKRNDELIEVPNVVPAIISKETFDKAKEIRKSRKCFENIHHTNKLDFIICSCGGKMGYSQGYYKCHRCHTHIRSELLYKILAEDIQVIINETIADKDKIKAALVKKFSKYDDRKYQELRKQKQKIDKQFEVAFENMINGVITSEQYSKKVKELNIIHDSLESEMNLIMVDLSQKAILKKELTRFLSMLSNIKFEYDENNLELFEKLINRVIVERPQRRYKKVNVNISYKFSK